VKKLGTIGLAATMLLTGCTTTGLQNDTTTRTVVGAATGAALGALGGHASGAGAFEGAALGAVAGGAAGAIVPGKVFEGRQYYRDTRGYCYFVDRSGQPHYDGTVNC
jgi:uncharacterized protein YcfJ